MNARLRGLAGLLNGRPMLKTVVPAIVLVLIGTVLATNPAARPVATGGPGSPVAGASQTAGPDGGPVSTEPPEPWEALVLGPIEQVAEITPNRLDRTGVATTSAFTLRSLGDTAATELAKGVSANPPLEFRVRAGSTAKEVVLQPAEPMLEGTTYRLTLTRGDGGLGGSWAFRTQRPLEVARTVPGNRKTGVAVDSGIEVTFDQDGSTGFEAHFRIEPEVAGRFEQHDRTWAFVPDRPLDYASAYRVTVTAGVGLEGSNLELRSAYSFQFETEPEPGPREHDIAFTSPMAAVRPDQEASLLVEAGRRSTRPDTLATRIYRLPDLRTTLAAASRLTGPDRWLRVSGAGLYPTDDLERVASFDARLIAESRGIAVLEIPMQLDPGAYLVVVPRRTGTLQLLLQVTNLSAYAVSTETRTIAWVNSLGSLAPVAGARVTMPGGRELGRSDNQGLAQFATPDELLPRRSEGDRWSPDPRLLGVHAPDGRWLVVALGSPVSWLDGDYDNALSQARSPSERFWLVLNTDREAYRQTDTIHVWGLARARDDRSLPDGVELRLRPASGDETDLAIARVPVTLSGRGAYTADLPIADLPMDSYVVELLIGGRVAAYEWIEVVDLRKPSYQLAIETDRHAYLEGEPLGVTIRATFFDGSPVPGVDLRVRASEAGGRVTVTTDEAGIARTTLQARFTSDQPEGYNSQFVGVRSAQPEEGEISASTSVVVFPSTAWLTGGARLAGSTLTIHGSLTGVPFDRLNASYDPGNWRWPSHLAGGPALVGRTVSLRVSQVRWVREQTGTSYDYLEKRVTPVYRWREIQTNLGTFQARTDSDGNFRHAMTVPATDAAYDVFIHATDAAGRPVVTSVYARTRIDRQAASSRPFLVRGFCGFAGSTVAGLDAPVQLAFHQADGRVANEGRFLWLVASRGLRDVRTSGDATFSRRLRNDDLPGFTVRGVQVTRDGYATAEAFVEVDLGDLTIDVRLQPTREHYAPGSRATVEVRTIGPDGRPIAADVVIQGIDEKLYAIGAASEANVLAELHHSVSNGFLQSFASHRIPSRSEEGGCGATGGGGPRNDFGDVVTFQLVHTGADGRATASFDLLDDLTSWRISGMAISHDLKAGVGSTLLPVSLPFFVDSVLAPEYLAGEAPVLRLRAYGEALRTSEAVRFTVHAPSLFAEDLSVAGVAFEAARVSLPELPLGRHRIRIDAYGPGDRHDAVIRVIDVVPSRLAALATEYDVLTKDFVAGGGDGLTRYTVSDAGRGSLIRVLVDLASTRSARFDNLAAAQAARQLLIDEFGFEARELREVQFDARSFDDDGIALLPYADHDLELSALGALLVPATTQANSLRDYLSDHAGDKGSRETRVISLAGLAALGDDVLVRLQAMADDELTIREALWLALGLVAAGDENGARRIERALLEAHGQRLGPWVRLEVGSDIDDTVDAARLLLVLSARLGEPFAADVARYLDDHPTKERSIALERLGYVEAMLERLPRTPTRFAWSVDRQRHEIRLRPGGAWSIVLTPQQRATFRLDPLEGHLAVVTAYSATDAPLPTGSLATIERTVDPAGDASEARLVHVEISVTFDAQATFGCWLVTDVVPSGLVPLHRWGGHEVTWCFDPRDDERSFRYTARVVSPGTYTWEPAVIQALDAPEVGDATDPFVYRIR